MNKKTCIIFIFILAILNFYILSNFIYDKNKIVNANVYTNSNGIAVRAYGDSISAGYGLDGYNDYVNKTTLITKECYPNVFMQEYIDVFGGTIKSFAVTGDKSNKLVEDLVPYINKTAQDYEDFCNTDVFTLCIGANNILSIASANLEKLLKGEMQISEYELLLSQSVDAFNSDYTNYILPALSINKNAIVIAMTVYNPYKYVTFNDIKVDTQDAQNNFLVKSVLSALDQTFQQVLKTTIIYLEKINDIIRQNEKQNIVVVDVYNLFETFTKDQYKTYINADLSKMTITKELYQSIDWQNMHFSNLLKNLTLCADPHPTQKGQEVIANFHKNNFPVFKLNLQTDLTKIQNDEQDVFFSIIKVGGSEDYTFKLYKNIKNNITLLKETKNYSLNVKAKDLQGDGYIYVQIFENNKNVGQTNNIKYVYQLQNQQDTSQEEQEIVEFPKNNNLENHVIAGITMSGIVAFCIVLFVVLKCYKKNNIK